MSELPEKARNVLKRIRKKYKVGFDPLRISGIEVQILKVTDLEHLLAGKDPFDDVSNFPFWIKVWEAALILSGMMAALPVKEGQTLLELGAGLGAPGLVAASRGYKVTLSDYEPHILDFQRVSAAANKLDNIEFRMIDWKEPPEMEPFDTIIGAEILFREEFFQPLLNVFEKYLAPNGTIFLAHDARRKSVPLFINLAQKDYRVDVKETAMRSEDGEIKILIHRLQRKQR